MEDMDVLIESIRQFNRFYTVNMGLLSANYLDSRYSVAQIRILFELDRRTTCVQNDIVHAVKIDKSYLSRIIQSLYNKRLIDKAKAEKDKREVTIRLTALGKAEVATLIERTNRQIQAQIEPLNVDERDRLHKALQTVISILGGQNENSSV